MEQAARVWRDGFQIPPLRLSVERAECQRRLAGARHSGEDDERVARDLHVDVLQVVFAGPSNSDESRHCPVKCKRRAGGNLWGCARQGRGAASTVDAPRAWPTSCAAAASRRTPPRPG